jgi:methionyl-tRNA formyltransferase
MKVVFAGSKTIGSECLEWLFDSGHNIKAVFGHRQEAEHDVSLRDTADKLGLPFFDTNINKMAHEVEQLGVEYLFSVQYGPILKKRILEAPSCGCWNLHCGDLPRYGGCKVVLQAIWNGEPNIAITFHEMDEGIDTGMGVCKGYVSVADRTAKELYPYLNKGSFSTFKRGVNMITNGEPVPLARMTPQLYYRMSALDISKQRVMQWDETMEECRRRAAAFTLIDGTLPTTQDGLGVKHLRKETKMPVTIYAFGEVLKVEDDRYYIAVRDGVISCELVS